MTEVKNLVAWFSGKKTYLVALATVLTGVVSALNAHKLNLANFLVILNGSGLGFLRAGVSKAQAALGISAK